MLSYISTKFSSGPKPHIHEPRAALFVNRFTRTLTIMYATNGLAPLLGISAQDLVGKSFYYCIQENCLSEAVRCLENAKANDSIAYLRFWYRDPRREYLDDEDESMSEGQSSDQDSEEGGVRLNLSVDGETSNSRALSSSSSDRYASSRLRPSHPAAADRRSGHSSSSTDQYNSSPDQVFDRNTTGTRSSASSLTIEHSGSGLSAADQNGDGPQRELEAVISCTSDGLVVILREARPFVLDSLRPPPKIRQPNFSNGYFASPWAQEPILPDMQPHFDGGGVSAPPLTNQLPSYFDPQHVPGGAGPTGPPAEAFWQSIRECAVFAWGLTGINGSLAQYGRGAPAIGAQPSGGLPVWQKDADTMRAHMRSPVDDRMEGVCGGQPNALKLMIGRMTSPSQTSWPVGHHRARGRLQTSTI